MLGRPGFVYRVTYRRQGWRAGRVKSVALLSERGARSFADKLTRTKDTSALAEVHVEAMAGVWMPLEDGPTVRRKSRTADPYAVDLSALPTREDDDDGY